jgi:hypothetical protein
MPAGTLVRLSPTITRGLQQHTLAPEAMKRPPSAPTVVTVGADITQADPAIIRTSRMWAVLRLRVHLARTATRGNHQRWWCLR